MFASLYSKNLRSFVGIFGILVTAIAFPTQRAAAAEPNQMTYKVVTHNVEKKWQPIQRAVDQAVASGAQALLLQEVCSDDYALLRSQHINEWSLAYTAVGSTTAGGQPSCPNPADPSAPFQTGNVAIWTGGIGGVARSFVYRNASTNPQTPTQNMTCVFYASGERRVCSVHTEAFEQTVQGNQIREIKEITDPWVAGGKLVVLAGDFNSQPSYTEMDNIYDFRSDRGLFREVSRSNGSDCRCGARTTDDDTRKIDFIFFSRNLLSPTGRRADTVFESAFTESDHRLLKGNADIALR